MIGYGFVGGLLFEICVYGVVGNDEVEMFVVVEIDECVVEVCLW